MELFSSHLDTVEKRHEMLRHLINVIEKKDSLQRLGGSDITDAVATVMDSLIQDICSRVSRNDSIIHFSSYAKLCKITKYKLYWS